MQQHLQEQLNNIFSPKHLEVINQSHMHAGDRENSHFKLIIVSDKFNNIKLIDRHRQVNKLFKEELKHIHALAIHTYTPLEWSKKPSAPKSPNCTGHNK